MKCDSYELEYSNYMTDNGMLITEMQPGRLCKNSAVIQYLPSNDSNYPWSGRCAEHAAWLDKNIQTRSIDSK